MQPFDKISICNNRNEMTIIIKITLLLLVLAQAFLLYFFCADSFGIRVAFARSICSVSAIIIESIVVTFVSAVFNGLCG